MPDKLNGFTLSSSHRFPHLCQQAWNIQVLRAFCQTCTATHTRRCRVAALHGRHRDSIIRHCTLLVAVQNVIVIYISEDISYGNIMRAWDALVTACTVDMPLIVQHGNTLFFPSFMPILESSVKRRHPDTTAQTVRVSRGGSASECRRLLPANCHRQICHRVPVPATVPLHATALPRKRATHLRSLPMS